MSAQDEQERTEKRKGVVGTTLGAGLEIVGGIVDVGGAILEAGGSVVGGAADAIGSAAGATGEAMSGCAGCLPVVVVALILPITLGGIYLF